MERLHVAQVLEQRHRAAQVPHAEPAAVVVLAAAVDVAALSLRSAQARAADRGASDRRGFHS